MKIIGILLAGGKSRRFGNEDKLLQEIDGKPVIYYSLLVLEKTYGIDEVLLVSDDKKINILKDLVRNWNLRKVKDVIEGGKERQDSVFNAINSISQCDYVLIHDGARPFISVSLVEKIIKEGIEKKAVITAIPVKDTIKLVGSDKRVESTLPREKLWQIQTPQFFEFSIIKTAHENAKKDNFYGTDDAVLVERLGIPVYIIEGEPWNIKITTKEDLELAKCIIKKRYTELA